MGVPTVPAVLSPNVQTQSFALIQSEGVGVGIPTLPAVDVAVSIPCNNLTQNPQCLPISEISRSRGFGAFHVFFSPEVKFAALSSSQFRSCGLPV